MTIDIDKDIGAIFREGVHIDCALKAAAREAILRHKQLGQPIPIWRDGKTVLVSAEELEAKLQAASSKK